MTDIEIEINKKVYEAYPKTKKEFTCWQEKMRLAELRGKLRERLLNEWAKKDIEGFQTKDGVFR